MKTIEIDWFWLAVIAFIIAGIFSSINEERTKRATIAGCYQSGGTPVVEFGNFKECKK